MASILLQNAVGSITVYLELSAGGPATGLTHTSLTAGLRKPAGSFVAFTLTALNFTEIGAGFYEVDFAASDLDTLGNNYFRLSGATIDTTLSTIYVTATAPEIPGAPISVPTTTIYGYIYDASGAAVSGASVACRVLSVPTVLYQSSDGLVLSESLITARTGSDGYFALELVTGAEVDFFISSAGYRRTFTVPASSSNVFDIP